MTENLPKPIESPDTTKANGLALASPNNDRITIFDPESPASRFLTGNISCKDIGIQSQ